MELSLGSISHVHVPKSSGWRTENSSAEPTLHCGSFWTRGSPLGRNRHFPAGAVHSPPRQSSWPSRTTAGPCFGRISSAIRSPKVLQESVETIARQPRAIRYSETRERTFDLGRWPRRGRFILVPYDPTALGATAWRGDADPGTGLVSFERSVLLPSSSPAITIGIHGLKKCARGSAFAIEDTERTSSPG